MKKSLSVFVFIVACSLFSSVYAQSTTNILGPSTVTVGTTANYLISGFVCPAPDDMNYGFWMNSGPVGGWSISHDGSQEADITFTKCGVYVIRGLRPCQGFVAGYKTVTVTDPSIGNPTASAPSTSTCLGSNASLTASGCSSPTIITWYDNASATGAPIGTGSPVSVSLVTNQTYYAFCQNNTNLCKSLTPASVSVTVNPSPNFNVNSPTICAGSNATFNLTGLSNTSILRYRLLPSGTFSSLHGASLTITSPSVGTHNYEFLGISVAGCSTLVSATLTVNATPSAPGNSGDNNLCPIQPITISPNIGSGGNSINWISGSSCNGTNAPTCTFTPSSNTTVCYRSINTSTGCVSSQQCLNISVCLPVTIVSFTGNELGRKAHVLSWATEQEINVSHYSVERKNINEQFETIGTIPSNASTSSNQYEFIDNNPKVGENIYRLKSIDTDGSYEYANNLVQLFNTPSNFVSVYPNPTYGELILSLNTHSKVKVEVSNNLGQVIYSDFFEGTNEISIDCSVWTPGMYNVKIDFNGQSENQRIMLK